jgi:hypothetical protein
MQQLVPTLDYSPLTHGNEERIEGESRRILSPILTNTETIPNP